MTLTYIIASSIACVVLTLSAGQFSWKKFFVISLLGMMIGWSAEIIMLAAKTERVKIKKESNQIKKIEVIEERIKKLENAIIKGN